MTTNTNADAASEKRAAFAAATALIAKRDDCSLRYAALELRRCIEAFVYEKLKVYGALLPEDSVHQWQPPQAFDALIAVEPKAEGTTVIFVAPQGVPHEMAAGPYRQLGTDERPKGKWVKKTWHKLGFFLHADWPFAESKAKAGVAPWVETAVKTLVPVR
jgi:hypothetical protein